MEWIERLNDAIGYIEEHLTKEIDYERRTAVHISVEEKCPLPP